MFRDGLASTRLNKTNRLFKDEILNTEHSVVRFKSGEKQNAVA